MGEKVVRATISPHLYTLWHRQVQSYLPLEQLHSQAGDFSNGLCYIMKTAVAESNPEIEPITHVLLYPQRHG